MRAVIAAVRALLGPLENVPVYYVEVPDAPTYPHLLLWSSTGRLTSPTLDGALTTLSDTLGVTCVGLTAESVLAAQGRARVLLHGAVPAAEGWHMNELRLIDAEPVQVDRDVSLPRGGHPKYGVDLYALSGVRV